MIHDYKSCWPTLGPFRYSRGAQKGPFGLKQGLTGRKAPGARFMTRFGPYCCQLVWLGCNHGYHTLWPGAGTLLGPTGAPKGPVLTQNAPFGGPGGPPRARRGQIWSQLLPIVLTGLESFYHTLWPGLGPFLGPQGPKKGPFFAQNAPFRDPEGPRRAQRGQIWSQNLRAAVHGLDTWLQ